MRLWSTLLLAAAPLAAVAQARREAQVYLHPAPTLAAHKAAPTLTSSQAETVIGHHLGVDLSGSPTPHDKGVWAHLLHFWEGQQRPRVVIVEGVDAQVILPTALKSGPAFYLDDASVSCLDPYIAAAREALERVSKLPIVKNLLDTLDLATTRAGRALSAELSALVTLADSLWTSAESTWDAVAVRLGRAEHGSELWNTAITGLKAGLESMTQPNSPPVVLVIMPAAGRHGH
ncbi:uncharacterized protein EHS24_007777 [Apiotrichum porosum]|uniref:Uncharacterized protein n=1 Tax=Apiotrichum porosum TaxID=105984 RepID=A0A427XVC3_9TREE|nr:uncharacterized protein EHS24_007777 [Apiotrichum porosum]RSH82782.1 hypothetical protein EHS24_007777 [Apiotrichum porosum]